MKDQVEFPGRDLMIAKEGNPKFKPGEVHEQCFDCDLSERLGLKEEEDNPAAEMVKDIILTKADKAIAKAKAFLKENKK